MKLIVPTVHTLDYRLRVWCFDRLRPSTAPRTSFSLAKSFAAAGGPRGRWHQAPANGDRNKRTNDLFISPYYY